MQPRWILSQFFYDSDYQMDLPVCAAYGGDWVCPTMPATPEGWALVQLLCNTHQLDAASSDSRIVICPVLADPSPLPSAVTDAYASWGATAGMSMAQLLAKLGQTEPVFIQLMS